MPTFRVTYRPYAGARRLLLEDVEADRHDVRGGWHVLAQVQLVCGMPRWICKLRAPAVEVVDVRVMQLHHSARYGRSGSGKRRRQTGMQPATLGS